MSYILDALKKSEKERQRGTAPDLLTVQETVLPEKKKRRVWPYIIFAVLIFGMGLAAFRLIPWQSKNEKAGTSNVALQKSEPNPAESLQPEVSQTITTQAGDKETGSSAACKYDPGKVTQDASCSNKERRKACSAKSDCSKQNPGTARSKKSGSAGSNITTGIKTRSSGKCAFSGFRLM